jgi:hypothetical protein
VLSAAATSVFVDEFDEGPVYEITADRIWSPTEIAGAMQAAEAAQSALLSRGPLADEAQSNQLLRSILQTYGTVQRSYHKAMLPLIQRHGSLGTSPAGLAYSLYCEVLGRQPDKQPGDNITNFELQLQQKQVKQLPAAAANQPLAQLATALFDSLELGNRAAREVFVMPQVTLFLGLGWVSASGEKLGDDLNLSGPLRGIASMLVNNIASEAQSAGAYVGQGLLLEACQAHSQPCSSTGLWSRLLGFR